MSVGGHLLATGDGAGVIGERVLSLTASEDAEILALDVGGAHLASFKTLELRACKPPESGHRAVDFRAASGALRVEPLEGPPLRPAPLS